MSWVAERFFLAKWEGRQDDNVAVKETLFSGVASLPCVLQARKGSLTEAHPLGDFPRELVAPEVPGGEWLALLREPHSCTRTCPGKGVSPTSAKRPA